MKIVLIGFMCSGKTRVGKILAKKLGQPHFDTDEMIVKQVGSSIADIINKQGEAEFRKIERTAVSLVAMSQDCVISTGGGVPTVSENMKDLSRDAYVIWLKVTPEVVLKRAGNIKKRPLIDAKRPLESIRERLEKRIPFYAKAAMAIDTDNFSPDQIASQIMEIISKPKK